jgi:diguanylate cyclase
MIKQTDQTLIEQMRISEFEIEFRKRLFSISQADADLLHACRPAIEKNIDSIVDEFYRLQTSVPEIALLIGDADTLRRLRTAQRRYTLDLFGGLYDLDYVNNRLRISLVHKRIGVEPKLYLSAIHILKEILYAKVASVLKIKADSDATCNALTRLLLFDVSLVFDTYIRSLISEIETAKINAERYANALEEKVRERTQQLETQSRTDPLTGLLNVRYLMEIVTKHLCAAERRAEPITAIYLDVNNFKNINDTQGHQCGDAILRAIAEAIRHSVRPEDSCFRNGGDEFCVILTNCTKEHAISNYITRLNEIVTHSLSSVSLSIGIVQTGPDVYVDADTLIRQADEQMYANKRASKIPELPASGG